MSGPASRLQREMRTMSAMVELFCRDHHGPDDTPCRSCSSLVDYALCRLEKCPYGRDKPTCDHCPIHCYRPDRREQIREVMRYSGPRFAKHHPVLAIRHLLDQRREAPEQPSTARKDS